MRFSVLEINRRILTRTAAIALIGGVAAGCSSSATRFNDGVDGMFTASTNNQRSIIRPGTQQYPGDVQAAPVSSVSRGNLAPAKIVAAEPLPPVRQPAPTAVPAPPQLPSTSVALANSRLPEPKPAGGPGVLAPAGNAPVPVPRTLSANDRNSTSLTNAGKAVANTVQDAKGSYTVQEGDTITAIARKTGVSAAALKSANGMNDGLIRVGQKLTIPTGAVQVANAQSAAVATTTTNVANTAKKATEQVTGYTPPKKAEKVIEDVEQQAAIAPNATGIGRLRWPVRGRVISNYGGNSGGKANDGIDISVPEGTSVKAAENGVVIYAGDGLKEFGNTVLVRHEDGLVTVYGHASSLKVTRGEKVKRGQEIALSGTSGSADTPKLHFEVRKNSSPVDPSKFLE